MLELSKIKNSEISILHKEPTKIYNFSIILILTLFIFIVFGFLWHYSKYEKYVAMSVSKNGEICLEIITSIDNLEKFQTNELIIDNKKYEFKIIEIQKNSSDNNYKIILKVVNLNLENEKYFIINLQTSPTTIFKEIYKKVKEDLEY